MRFTASAFLGLALLLFGEVSWAEEPAQASEQPNSPRLTKEEKKAWSYFLLEEVLLRRSDDPTLRTSLALPQPKLILETTDDGKTKFKARVGMEMQDNLVVNLEVASPTSKSGDTTLATQDGLSNGSTAEVSLSWIPRRYMPDLSETDIQGIYRAMKDDAGPEASPESMLKYGETDVLRPSAVAALGSLDKYNEAVEQCQKKLAEDYRAIPFLTVQTKIDRQQFHFVDRSTFKANQKSHTGHQFTASLGFYLWGKVYSALSYSRVTTFLAGETANLCSPFESTSSLRCRNLVLGPPTKKPAETLDFEIRRLFGSFGVAARLNHNLEADVTAIEVPIYFLQKMGTSGMELNSGVALKWQSDTKDYSISAFIGPALSTVFRRGNG